MSSYSLSSIRNDVKIIVSPEDDSSLTDAFYNQRINEAIEDIVYELEPKEFETTDTSLSLTTSTRNVDTSSLSSAILFLQSVKDTTAEVQLSPITREEADNWDEDTTGEPAAYFHFGTNIEIYPLPSSDYDGDTLRLRYIKKPSALTSDSQTSPLPAYLDQAIRKYAAAACLSDLQEPELAMVHFRIYRANIKSRGMITAKEMRYQSRRITRGL